MGLFDGAGKAATDRFFEKIAPVLKQVSPLEILKIVFTPENVRALGEGVGYGATKALMERKEQ